jgi:hypothetical protein
MQRTKYNDSRQNAAESLEKPVIVALALDKLLPEMAIVRCAIPQNR